MFKAEGSERTGLYHVRQKKKLNFKNVKCATLKDYLQLCYSFLYTLCLINAICKLIRSKFDYYILTSQILIIAMLFLPMTMTQEWMNGVKQTVKSETVRLMFVHVTHEKYGS